ncbi:hypothetical protein MKQ68_15105 [Chitinophaga horti]|uniref:Uncharacterized protein n=1 Tax=Chitinophaga horti TaxID=2920382 RepID=A0ABY6IVW1_9BACT|nr:hypothetical protein [Chitinophaga horti]UYQ91420.1 hypothetical protein MKQ68_15105 [Chitinophaga horti]
MDILDEIKTATLDLLGKTDASMQLGVKSLKKEIGVMEKKTKDLEEKYFAQKISQDTYDRWSREYFEQLTALRARLKKTSTKAPDLLKLYEEEIGCLGDLKEVFARATVFWCSITTYITKRAVIEPHICFRD